MMVRSSQKDHRQFRLALKKSFHPSSAKLTILSKGAILNDEGYSRSFCSSVKSFFDLRRCKGRRLPAKYHPCNCCDHYPKTVFDRTAFSDRTKNSLEIQPLRIVNPDLERSWRGRTMVSDNPSLTLPQTYWARLFGGGAAVRLLQST